MKLSSDHLWHKIWVANFLRIHNLPLMMRKWEKVICSWTFGLFLTFVIECGHIHIPNRDFWGYSSRPQIGDLVTNHSLLWDPLSLAWDGPKMALFWPNMASLSALQIGPKGFKWPKMANLSVGFSGENYLLPQKHIVPIGWSSFERKIPPIYPILAWNKIHHFSKPWDLQCCAVKISYNYAWSGAWSCVQLPAMAKTQTLLAKYFGWYICWAYGCRSPLERCSLYQWRGFGWRLEVLAAGGRCPQLPNVGGGEEEDATPLLHQTTQPDIL